MPSLEVAWHCILVCVLGVVDILVDLLSGAVVVDMDVEGLCPRVVVVDVVVVVEEVVDGRLAENIQVI